VVPGTSIKVKSFSRLSAGILDLQLTIETYFFYQNPWSLYMPTDELSIQDRIFQEIFPGGHGDEIKRRVQEIFCERDGFTSSEAQKRQIDHILADDNKQLLDTAIDKFGEDVVFGTIGYICYKIYKKYAEPSSKLKQQLDISKETLSFVVALIRGYYYLKKDLVDKNIISGIHNTGVRDQLEHILHQHHADPSYIHEALRHPSIWNMCELYFHQNEPLPPEMQTLLENELLVGVTEGLGQLGKEIAEGYGQAIIYQILALKACRSMNLDSYLEPRRLVKHYAPDLTEQEQIQLGKEIASSAVTVVSRIGVIGLANKLIYHACPALLALRLAIGIATEIEILRYKIEPKVRFQKLEGAAIHLYASRDFTIKEHKKTDDILKNAYKILSIGNAEVQKCAKHEADYLDKVYKDLNNGKYTSQLKIPTKEQGYDALIQYLDERHVEQSEKEEEHLEEMLTTRLSNQSEFVGVPSAFFYINEAVGIPTASTIREYKKKLQENRVHLHAAVGLQFEWQKRIAARIEDIASDKTAILEEIKTRLRLLAEKHKVCRHPDEFLSYLERDRNLSSTYTSLKEDFYTRHGQDKKFPVLFTEKDVKMYVTAILDRMSNKDNIVDYRGTWNLSFKQLHRMSEVVNVAAPSIKDYPKVAYESMFSLAWYKIRGLPDEKVKERLFQTILAPSVKLQESIEDYNTILCYDASGSSRNTLRNILRKDKLILLKEEVLRQKHALMDACSAVMDSLVKLKEPGGEFKLWQSEMFKVIHEYYENNVNGGCQDINELATQTLQCVKKIEEIVQPLTTRMFNQYTEQVTAALLQQELEDSYEYDDFESEMDSEDELESVAEEVEEEPGLESAEDIDGPLLSTLIFSSGEVEPTKDSMLRYMLKVAKPLEPESPLHENQNPNCSRAYIHK
jgi:hypothetical protein